MGTRADALEGLLTLVIHATPTTTLRDHWHIALPFARNAELQFQYEGRKTVLRYRRLFR
jgi:hypothetical protein